MNESSSGALRSVLIVTGSDRTRRMYAEYLGWRGIAVREVESAGAAMLELTTFRPDVVVTDERLPDSTGQELVRALRRARTTFNLPVVLLASDTFGDAADTARRYGCNRVLIVPVLPEALLDAMQATIAACRATAEQRPFESWLFTRADESVWMVRTSALELAVAGPGAERAAFTFAEEHELLSFQTEYEQRLLRTGFALEVFGDDRRSGRDRRRAPRAGVIDRRTVA